MKHILTLASLLALSGCVSGDKLTDPEDVSGESIGSAQSEIISGTTVNYVFDTRAYSILKVSAWNTNPVPAHYGTCTGTLITDRWVLTAAHCIDPAWKAYTAVYTQPGIYVWATHVFTHPDAAPYPDVAVGYVDAALLKLPSALTGLGLGWNASPTPYVGQQVKCYGFGWISEAGTNPATGTLPPSLLSGTLAVTGIFGEPRTPGGINVDPTRLKIAKTPTGISLAPGDSGGPCFDVSTGAQVGVQSTVWHHKTTNLILGSEQTKFNHIRQWVIDTITNN